ncbi:unnamed protein product [Mytilus edulis]|uniref:TIR domain-containing protein n=1 Tax=Mytilus edulis TaxID=6550 RepID=A0A8S3UPN2_MYTED|nr:unnamed protein product [Mytilus edulis]
MKKSVTPNMSLLSADASYVFLPTSLEKLDISYTVLNTVPAVWLIVPENNNLIFLDISYSNTTCLFLIFNLQLLCLPARGEVVVWIKDVLIPKLEDEWGLAMCIKDRDFLSGTSLADIEAASIENSRSIIFVITPEFKSSHDCLFELDRAKYEKITKNLERIIVITKDITITDIPVEFSFIWNYAYLIQWPNDPENLDDTWRKLSIFLTDGSVSYQ